MKRSYVWIVVLLALASLGCSAESFLVPATPAPSAPKPNVAPTANVIPTAMPLSAGGAPGADETLLENIYLRVDPAVVNITVSSGTGNQLTEMGTGSGFVIDKQGHIVTNNHVVAGATEVDVTFSDGRVATAQIVGTDSYGDLAVIKVDVPESWLTPAELGDSDQVKVGQYVIAIGNPFGLQGSMTLGIVSALGRTLPADRQPTQSDPGVFQNPQIIQTDAAINPGNSGGPLLDLGGRVIGVNAAIRTDTAGTTPVNSGVGFAIPVNTVKRVAPQLIEKGSASYPYLGVSVDRNFSTPELAQALKLPVEFGVVVASVSSGGPADQAGMLGGNKQMRVRGVTVQAGGDIITAIDGNQIRDFDAMIAYLANKTQVGQTVTLTILRDGKEMQVKVKLGERPK
jgi:S1-C subfamily serine protease